MRLSSIFDWEVRRLGMRDRVKTRNDNGLRNLDIFTKIAVFLWKKCFKDKLRSTIHYTYTSYNKYFRLCMISEELWLNDFSSIDYTGTYLWCSNEYHKGAKMN